MDFSETKIQFGYVYLFFWIDGDPIQSQKICIGMEPEAIQRYMDKDFGLSIHEAEQLLHVCCTLHVAATRHPLIRF